MVNKRKQKLKKWYLPILVVLIYGAVLLFNPDKAMPILTAFVKVLKQIAPNLLIVYAILVLTNMYVNNKKIRKHMGDDAGYKGWMISIIAGIISMGSIYVWYPLLKDLKDKGVKDKFIATFLYNRGIKLQWLPILLLYFGWVYSITLVIVMIVVSVFQGVITGKLIESCCNSRLKLLARK